MGFFLGTWSAILVIHRAGHFASRWPPQARFVYTLRYYVA
jgi:hypothetical protein